MKLRFVKYEEKNFILPKPVATAKGEINSRTVFYVYLQDEKGNVAKGEAPPLDGFSFETVNDLRKKLKYEFADCREIISSFDFISLTQFDNELKKCASSFPTLIFALGQAFVRLAIKNNLANENNLNLIKEKLSEINKFEPKRNALISLVKSDFENKLKDLVLNGYETIKIKLPAKFDGEKLSVLKKFNVKFRFDPNGVWGKDEAEENLNLLSRLNIDYVEDPAATLPENIELAEKFPNVLAIDLSARNIDDLFFALENGVKIFVIKPAFLGSTDLLRFIAEARERNARVIISSVFETKTAREFLLAFASLFPEETHGLMEMGLKEI